MESVVVTLSPEGVPVAFTIGGDVWFVSEEPVRWYERTRWWETDFRMPRGRGHIDVEVWQLQANPAEDMDAPQVTFILVRNQDTGEWHLRSFAEVKDSTVDDGD